MYDNVIIHYDNHRSLEYSPNRYFGFHPIYTAI